MIKAVSLFTGAGGMDTGFENAGISVVMANELASYACDTYETNHRGVKLIRGDIVQHMDDFKQLRNIDLVFGGPPCQGFSVAGKMNPDDVRSQMIWRFLEVVEILQPKVFVMENVKALGKLEKWAPIRKKFLEQAFKMGYYCSYSILNSADFGVSQKRERVIFVGSKREYAKTDLELAYRHYYKKAPTLREVFLKLPPIGSRGNENTCTARITTAETPILRKSPYAGMLFNGMGRPLNLESLSTTLPASMGGNKTPIIDESVLRNPRAEDWVKKYHDGLLNGTIQPKLMLAPSQLRRMSITEAALVQSFPYEYKFQGSKSSIYTQIGNAVPCKMAESVARAVIDVCFEEKTYKESENLSLQLSFI